ncbi:MAG: hypothetical protein HYZ72_10300 [Deltaproteobacteria bacterium]|nr:hypothetical protein [Deltaproteobacteria bacterium]
MVEKEAYLLELCRYVVLNPVRARLVSHPRAWRWSSYRATAGEEPVPPWLTVEWVLGQCARRLQPAQQAYRRFVADGLAGHARPWDSVRSQIYLGSEGFLQQLQHKLRKLDEAEIPEAQRRPGRPTLAAVLRQVAQGYAQSVEVVVKPTRRPSEARQVGIYVARRVAGADLKTIAQHFGLGYTGVSRRVGIVADRLRHDPRFRAQVERILNAKVKA